MNDSDRKQVAAEFVGTAILVAAIVGSGIMGERLAGGNIAITLMANSLATGAVLLALILTFVSVSGAHFNPLITLAATRTRKALSGVTAQFAGGVLGVAAANIMFGLPAFFASQHIRAGLPQLLSEAIATFGLVMIVRVSASPFAIAGYIVGAYWFTSSTSFANPAVTVARALTDTFSGIRPADLPGFLAAQAAGGLSAALFSNWLTSKPEETS